jgi:hypothetical protein
VTGEAYTEREGGSTAKEHPKPSSHRQGFGAWAGAAVFAVVAFLYAGAQMAAGRCEGIASSIGLSSSTLGKRQVVRVNEQTPYGAVYQTYSQHNGRHFQQHSQGGGGDDDDVWSSDDDDL